MANSRNVLIFLSDDVMGRTFCNMEQRWGIKYGCNFVGVVEMDSRHSPGSFEKEKERAPDDLKHLLDEVEFEPYQRREHLLQAMVQSVLRKGGCTPGARRSDLESSATAARELYLHLALQPPPVVFGESAARLQAVEARLEDDRAQWVEAERFPICLSDAGAGSCAVEAQLRQGAVHALVWCAKGDGWEARTDAAGELMPSVGRMAEIIRLLPGSGCAPPAVAVVCLQHGARRAAAVLREAGVPAVVWFSVDSIGGGSEGLAALVCDVVAPVLKFLEGGGKPGEVCKLVRAVTAGAAHSLPSRSHSARFKLESGGEGRGCDGISAGFHGRGFQRD